MAARRFISSRIWSFEAGVVAPASGGLPTITGARDEASDGAIPTEVRTPATDWWTWASPVAVEVALAAGVGNVVGPSVVESIEIVESWPGRSEGSVVVKVITEGLCAGRDNVAASFGISTSNVVLDVGGYLLGVTPLFKAVLGDTFPLVCIKEPIDVL